VLLVNERFSLAGGDVFTAVAGFGCGCGAVAGTMWGVSEDVVPDRDLAVVAELQGMLIEILKTRNAELTPQVADLWQRLARPERAVSGNSGNSGMPPVGR
jgi:hypothetical protein